MFEFIRNIGPTEIIIVALIILLLFGGKKLTELARGLGESKKELGKIKKELSSDEATEVKEENKIA